MLGEKLYEPGKDGICFQEEKFKLLVDKILIKFSIFGGVTRGEIETKRRFGGMRLANGCGKGERDLKGRDGVKPMWQ